MLLSHGIKHWLPVPDKQMTDEHTSATGSSRSAIAIAEYQQATLPTQ